MVYFYFLLDNASDKLVGMTIVFGLIEKVLCDGENYWKHRENARGFKGWFMHFLVPSLTEMRNFGPQPTWDSISTWNEEIEIITSF